MAIIIRTKILIANMFLSITNVTTAAIRMNKLKARKFQRKFKGCKG